MADNRRQRHLALVQAPNSDRRLLVTKTIIEQQHSTPTQLPPEPDVAVTAPKKSKRKSFLPSSPRKHQRAESYLRIQPLSNPEIVQTFIPRARSTPAENVISKWQALLATTAAIPRMLCEYNGKLCPPPYAGSFSGPIPRNLPPRPISPEEVVHRDLPTVLPTVTPQPVAPPAPPALPPLPLKPPTLSIADQLLIAERNPSIRKPLRPAVEGRKESCKSSMDQFKDSLEAQIEKRKDLIFREDMSELHTDDFGETTFSEIDNKGEDEDAHTDMHDDMPVDDSPSEPYPSDSESDDEQKALSRQPSFRTKLRAVHERAKDKLHIVSSYAATSQPACADEPTGSTSPSVPRSCSHSSEALVVDTAMEVDDTAPAVARAGPADVIVPLRASALLRRSVSAPLSPPARTTADTTPVSPSESVSPTSRKRKREHMEPSGTAVYAAAVASPLLEPAPKKRRFSLRSLFPHKRDSTPKSSPLAAQEKEQKDREKKEKKDKKKKKEERAKKGKGRRMSLFRTASSKNASPAAEDKENIMSPQLPSTLLSGAALEKQGSKVQAKRRISTSSKTTDLHEFRVGTEDSPVPSS